MRGRERPGRGGKKSKGGGGKKRNKVKIIVCALQVIRNTLTMETQR